MPGTVMDMRDTKMNEILSFCSWRLQFNRSDMEVSIFSKLLWVTDGKYSRSKGQFYQ